ncbi:MAG: CRISPR-associated endonuclease Cas2 [Lachnospiraceae bacterium]|jgi:CRISPR-associated protein Cas2|nr:CRISPR-associated endonuclease Cas2 [Lachnospiraceae bacterium]
MRLIVFFDLPTDTAKDRRNYTLFRKFLIKEGFIMMQESIYTKLALNGSVVESVKQKLHKAKPPYGLVQMLTVTEKQYASMEMLVGSSYTNVLNDTERLIIL